MIVDQTSTMGHSCGLIRENGCIVTGYFSVLTSLASPLSNGSRGLEIDQNGVANDSRGKRLLRRRGSHGELCFIGNCIETVGGGLEMHTNKVRETFDLLWTDLNEDWERHLSQSGLGHLLNNLVAEIGSGTSLTLLRGPGT